ncbi:MAG TPA: hypothetical protein VK395_01155 [Gemmataceae bacterium]|nr:hypothetical protein [Gemmataceae bacterium]
MTSEQLDQRASLDAELSWQKVRSRLEFFSWTTLALVPFLYWINGPSVSADQAVVRVALVGSAVVGAISLRFYSWKYNSRKAEDIGSVKEY